MARRTCQKCGKKIPETAQTCPRCGATQETKSLDPTPRSSSLGDTSGVPTEPDVVKWLDSEIDEARTAETRFGWTGWVLAAAVATTGWLLLDVWETQHLNLRLLAKWIIVLSIPIDAVGAWGSTFLTFPNPRLWGRRFRLFSDLGARRFALIFLAARYAALSALAVFAGIDVNAVARWLTTMFYGGMAAVWVWIVILTFFDVPFHDQRQQAPVWQRVVGMVVGYAPTLWVILSYSRTISWSPPGDSLSELKAAVLVVTAVGIAFFLIGYIHSSPVLGRLLDVRRKVMLGQVTPAIALREIEAVVIGMRGNVLLEEFLLKLLDFGAQFDEAARLPLFRVGYFEQVLATWPATRSSEVTLTTLKKGCKHATDDVMKLIKMLNEMKKRLDRFQGRLKDVQQTEPNVLLAPGNYESLERILSFVWTAYEERVQLAGQIAERLGAVRTMITEKERAGPTAGREPDSEL